MNYSSVENKLLQDITSLEVELSRNHQAYVKSEEQMAGLRTELHATRRNILIQYLEENVSPQFISFVVEDSEVGDFVISFSPQAGGEFNFEKMKNDLASNLQKESSYRIFMYFGKGIPWARGV